MKEIQIQDQKDKIMMVAIQTEDKHRLLCQSNVNHEDNDQAKHKQQADKEMQVT